MLDEVTLSRAVGLAGLLPGLLLVGLVVFAIIARLRGRAVGAVWRHLFAFSVGGHAGFAILVFDREPILRAVALFITLLIGLWLLWRGRRADAGWFALAVALPWTVLWGYFVVLIMTGIDFEPYTTVATFLLGAVPAGIAGIVALAGDPPPPEPRPDAPVGEPGSRRIGQLSTAFRAAMSVGPITTMELAGTVTVVVLAVAIGLALPLPPLAQAAVLVSFGTVLATEVALRAAPAHVHRALEAFAWLGEWELERARQVGLRRPIARRRDAERWLARVPEQPENRWLRWELLMFLERDDEAADVAGRIPDETAFGRFERAYAVERVAWGRGNAGDLATVRELAERIGPLSDEDRLRAEVSLAIREAVGRIADGGDPLAPLIGVREHLGRRPDTRIGALHRSQMRLAMFLTAAAAAFLAYLVDPLINALQAALR